MNKLTQEDLEIGYKLAGYYWHSSPFSASMSGWKHPDKEGTFRTLPNPYADDSFTGALVKAMFPLLAERNWVIQINNDGTIDICKFEEIDSNWSSRMVTSYLLIGMPNLNTALIEAWKKIEGENK